MIPSAAFARSPRVGTRELAGDEFEIALDQREIGPRLILKEPLRGISPGNHRKQRW